MQHLASRLNEKIDSIKKSMNRNMEDLMHRTKELSRKTEVEIKEKIIELKKAVENSNKQALEMDQRMKTNVGSFKKEFAEYKDQAMVDLD